MEDNKTRRKLVSIGGSGETNTHDKHSLSLANWSHKNKNGYYLQCHVTFEGIINIFLANGHCR